MVKGFSEEEIRLRARMMKMGLTQKELAKTLGLDFADVCDIVCQRSRAPRYRATVYEYLGLEMPEGGEHD
ncbi:MAG: helix-turn-helix transcriptional regulator [Clostridiales bacterium]|nr:helix-turn-helix transcriptional regulator [Clostridiales bacterium]